MRSLITLLTIFLFIAMIHNCGYYSFKGALPSYVQTIAVPLFNDQSSYPQIRENLTNKVVDSFIEDNTLKVVDESKADLILTGTIQPIRQQAATVQEGETVSNFKLTVNVQVKCEDVKTGKNLFDRSVSQMNLMSVNAGLEEREQAIMEALDLIADEIVDLTLGAW
ncbi:MAG: hypothetical protein GF313_09370 [Caldithrix sp.]|nr:hypothetical protein [Caldithrix sp.]